MNLFGNKGKKTTNKGGGNSSVSESIQQLRQAHETLEKREQHLNKQIQQAQTEALKRLKAKDKRGALHHMKRKKMYEKSLEQLYGKKNNIEVQISTLEGAVGNTEVLHAMRQGALALKNAVKESDVDKVADVMDEINDSMALAEEMGDAMAQPIGPVMDEDELTKEIEDMENELMSEDLLSTPVAPKNANEIKQPTATVTTPTTQKQDDAIAMALSSAPSVPKKKVEPAVTAEDAELRALTASMGM